MLGRIFLLMLLVLGGCGTGPPVDVDMAACGGLDRRCCPTDIGENLCELGLICGLTDTCVTCGHLGEWCCDYGATCSPGMRCRIGRCRPNN